jgi:tetraacyldisaccharide 4'-kinase
MSALTRMWWRSEEPWPSRALLSPLLLAEGLFRAGAAMRGALYDRGLLPVVRVPLPVVSAGNLAVGGAGKTPVAIAIGKRLLAAGRRVAVLSRGYGARRNDTRVVSDGRAILLGPAEGGDEPVLIARRLPGARVLSGPSRVDLARRAEEMGADVLLLDDGFQHRAMARDLDVVVIDASNPLGNGHCLPRGPGREPLSALARAGLAWLSRVDQAVPGELERLREISQRLTGRRPVESRHAPREVLDGPLARTFGLASLAGRRVFLLSGLARPASFRATVASLGARVGGERAFPDHHPFSEAEVDETLVAAARAGCDAVLTTEKDAVRLPPSRAGEERLRVLRIEAEVVAGGDVLDASLRECLAWHPPAARASSPAGGAGR